MRTRTGRNGIQMQQPTARPEEPAVRIARVVGPPPPPRVTAPPMTLAFAASMVLMAFVQFTASGYQWNGGDLGTPPIDWALGAKVPSLVAHGEYWRLITANFLHGSWLHLILNLLGLFVVGRMIEVFYGPARMFVIFVLSAVAGAATSYLLTTTVSLGASTGVLGLMGALVWHNWKYREYLPARINYVYPLLLALVAFQFATDMIQPDIDSFGHLGGFAAGIGVAMLLESRVSGEDQHERDWLPLPTALATAAGLLIYGGAGLLLALPREMPMLRAGSTHNPVERTELIRGIVAQRPYFTEARLQLALQLIQQGRNDEAMQEYQSAIAGNPSLASSRYGISVRDQMVLYFMGVAAALDRAGNLEPALVCYQRVLQLSPDPQVAAHARNNYAWLLADRLDRNLDEAEQYAVRATEDMPDHPAYLDTLAWIYLKQGRAEKALSTQLLAVKNAEETPQVLGGTEGLAELYYHLGAIYERLGKKPDAQSFYTKALEKRADYPEAKQGLDRVSDPADEPSRPRSTPAGTMI